MYKQMKKFITSGIIVATLLLMVTANAYSDYIYTWTDGYGSTAPGGTITLSCDAWIDDEVTKSEVIAFDFNGIDGNFTRSELSSGFLLEAGPTGTADIWAFDTTSPYHQVGMYLGSGLVSALSGWGVSVTEYGFGGSIDYRQYGGHWTFTREDCTAVPEPATLTLLGIGLVGLVGGAARKKLKKKAIVKT